MPPIEMWQGLLDGVWEWLLFSLVVLTLYGAFLFALLFSGLAIRAAWRWMRRHTWRDVVLFVERKAIR